MDRIYKIAKFHLLGVFKTQSIIFGAIILLNVLISLLVNANLTSTADNRAGSIDPVALIWIFILGLTLFPASFRFMLSHGISRRTFFIGAIVSIALMAAMWAILTTVFVLVTRLFTNIWVIYEMLYRNRAALGMAGWEFAALFLLAVLGWFFYLVYYVSGGKTRLLIAAVPLVAGPVLVLFNVLTDGGVFDAIGQFFIAALGLRSSTPNPYVAAINMLLLAVILCGANYLLARRAQIKD